MIRASVYSWQKKLLACGILAAAVGLAIGWRLQTRLQEPVLRFEQQEIDLRASPAIEGEAIDVVANLHNYGTVPLRITQAPMSS